jgi:hypothetical protein
MAIILLMTVILAMTVAPVWSGAYEVVTDDQYLMISSVLIPDKSTGLPFV